MIETLCGFPDGLAAEGFANPGPFFLLIELFSYAYFAAGDIIDFGILKWPTSAVCFGPPRVKRTSSLDLSDELGSGGGVGLESQGGVI